MPRLCAKVAQASSPEKLTEKAIETAQSYGIDLIARGYAAIAAEIHLPPEDSPARSGSQGGRGFVFEGGRDFVSARREPVRVHHQGIGTEPLLKRILFLRSGLSFETNRKTSCRLTIGIGLPAERIAEIPDHSPRRTRRSAILRLPAGRNRGLRRYGFERTGRVAFGSRPRCRPVAHPVPKRYRRFRGAVRRDAREEREPGELISAIIFCTI